MTLRYERFVTFGGEIKWVNPAAVIAFEPEQTRLATHTRIYTYAEKHGFVVCDNHNNVAEKLMVGEKKDKS